MQAPKAAYTVTASWLHWATAIPIVRFILLELDDDGYLRKMHVAVAATILRYPLINTHLFAFLPILSFLFRFFIPPNRWAALEPS